MTPENCPGCGAKLRPDMLACPNCPMSFPEDDGPAASVNPLKQSRYYQFVFPVVFFGAIGAIVWYLGTGLMRLGLANSEIENGNLFGGAPKPAAASAAGVSGGGASQPPEPKPPAEDGMIVISNVDENGTPIRRGAGGKGSDFARPAAIPGGVKVTAPPPEPLSEWKLRGTIYDLTTLKPLAGCDVLFTDEETNRSIKTRTDSAGRYRAIVPPLSERGYAVAVAKKGYAPNYLDPGAEGVQEKDAEERKAIARDLSATLGAPAATVQSVSAKPLVTDFYLAPRR